MTADREHGPSEDRPFSAAAAENGWAGGHGEGAQSTTATLADGLTVPLLATHGDDGADPDRVARVEAALSAVDNRTDETDPTPGGSLFETPLPAAATRAWEQVRTPGATLDIEADDTVLADPVALERILVTAFANAVEHAADAPAPGSLSVEYSTSPGQAVSVVLSRSRDAEADPLTVTVGALAEGFFVADDGPGFPPDVEAAAFESGEPDPTGLGLAAIEWFAGLQGWSVRATTGRDGGARLEFTGVEAE